MSGGRATERVSGLALLPVAATGAYYLLPPSLRDMVAIQFLPQIVGYLALAVWAAGNTAVIDRLGLRIRQVWEGLRWGLPTGLALGGINASVMIWLVPWLGYDITFLRETPHAGIPIALMVPWFILFIAAAVELNFRGFLLGRLLVLVHQFSASSHRIVCNTMAVIVGATVFSFDPFMVTTFRHLHWIAVWDGIVWGMIWVRLGNLHATITAHTVEVVVIYAILKTVLS
ncbi:MAG: hypothetical protein ACREJU_04500 [Nitrospiraceae bacterium]